MRRKLSRLTLEQLERRELFAGNFMPELAMPAADGFCGPLPLEVKKVAPGEMTPPTSEPTTPPPVDEGEEVDRWAQYGFGQIEAHVVDGTLVILPGSKTAELVVELPPRPEAQPPENFRPNIMIIGGEPFGVVGRPVGPVPPEQVQMRDQGHFGSLLESFYGSYFISPVHELVYGPQP